MKTALLPSTDRRRFLTQLALLTPLAGALGQARTDAALHLSCNQYTWSVYFNRDQRRFGEDLEADLREVAASGLDGFESSADSPEQIARLGQALARQNLQMRSLYVNSELHDADQAPASLRKIIEIATAAKPFGTRIIVTNPSPLRWGGPENKSDAQLEVQARNLTTLGRELTARGLQLAYHNHDI